MTSPEFDFSSYVRRMKSDGEAGEDSYVYRADREATAALRKLRPVALAVEATVRFFGATQRNDLLGGAVRVSEKQFPDIYKLVCRACERLKIPLPTVYIAPRLGSINAATYGTDEESFIIVHSATIDHLTSDELLFVLGHECGHIQNNHVVFLTAAYFLTRMTSLFLQWIVAPAVLALNAWSRRAEISCDRAGLIACGDETVAQRSLIKLGLGSHKLYEQLDIDEYLKQLEDVRKGVGRYAEAFHSHPYLPKRVQALRIFAGSRYYRERVISATGGMAMNTVDQKTGEVLGVA